MFGKCPTDQVIRKLGFQDEILFNKFVYVFTLQHKIRFILNYLQHTQHFVISLQKQRVHYTIICAIVLEHAQVHRTQFLNFASPPSHKKFNLMQLLILKMHIPNHLLTDLHNQEQENRYEYLCQANPHRISPSILSHPIKYTHTKSLVLLLFHIYIYYQFSSILLHNK